MLNPVNTIFPVLLQGRKILRPYINAIELSDQLH
jgi:hypothetical protein